MSENIDWNYTSHDMKEMWEELDRKIKSIIKNIPEVIIRFSKQGDSLEKLPWDRNQSSHKRKEFGIIPNMENY